MVFSCILSATTPQCPVVQHLSPLFMQERPSLLMHFAMVQSKAALPISLVISMPIIILA